MMLTGASLGSFVGGPGTQLTTPMPEAGLIMPAAEVAFGPMP